MAQVSNLPVFISVFVINHPGQLERGKYESAIKWSMVYSCNVRPKEIVECKTVQWTIFSWCKLNPCLSNSSFI